MELEHYTETTHITNFYPIPQRVLELNLSSTALLIYGILLNRASLSRKNGYVDATGWVYVVYTQEELAAMLQISTRITANHLRSLEKAGLIRKVRLSRKQANRYYLRLPADSMTGTGTGRKVPSDRKKPVFETGRKVHPNYRKEQQDLNYRYQHEEGESL